MTLPRLEPAMIDVAIIGAGFSGTAVALNLVRSARSQMRIVLVDRSGDFGRGLAYRTTDPSHLLNVPAAKMGVFADSPDHFYRWLQPRKDLWQAAGVRELNPASFVPRRLFAEYLSDQMREARRTRGPIELVADEAIDLVPGADGTMKIDFRSRPSRRARATVLALGNFPPGDPPMRDRRFHRSPRYLTDPWSPETREVLAKPGDVLILGSGLTGLDLIVSLSRTKTDGTIHVLSRRGLFPQPHQNGTPTYPTFLQADRLPQNARELCSLIRKEVAGAAERGIDWRSVVDALRPVTQEAWQALGPDEKRRFVRHLKSFWESHRHRAAPEVLGIKLELEAAGRLVCHSARVNGIVEANERLMVRFVAKTSDQPKELAVQYVVNCTGPECNYHKLKDPLVLQLFARGIITPDPLFLGLDVGSNGTILNLLGERVPNLYTLGSPQKGILLETTAVPELRAQARDLAQRLIQNFETAQETRTAPSPQAFEI